MKKKFFDFDVDVKSGDISKSNVDAIVIPEYYKYSERQGLAKIIGSEIGDFKAFDDYDEIAKNNKLAPADIVITNSYGKNFSKLIHVVTVGVPCSKDEEVAMVSGAVYNSIVEGYKRGIKSFSFPALNTVMGGRLNFSESAYAMIKGIEDAILNIDLKDNETPKINIIIYNNKIALDVFNKKLQDRIKDIQPSFLKYKNPKEMLRRIKRFGDDFSSSNIMGENFSKMLKIKQQKSFLDDIVVSYDR